MCDIENCSISCTNRMGEGLKRDGAKVERQAFEGSSRCIPFGCAGASAGGVGILRGPFAVGNV